MHRPKTGYSCDSRRFGADNRLCPLHQAAEPMVLAMEELLQLVARYGLGDDDRETEPVIIRAQAALALARRKV